MTSSTTYERIRISLEPEVGIATISLARPEKRNALDLLLLSEYCAALESLMNTDFRVIITEGDGPSFCAGMDLHELREWARNWDKGEFAWSDAGPLSKALQLLRQHTAVTLASVQGYCAGGGLALVVAHDLAIASRSAKFILPETSRGSFGALAAAAVHYALPPKKAFDMQLAGYELPAAEADLYGMISRVVEDDDLGTATRSLAEEVASRNKVPLAHAKMAYYLNEGRSFDDMMRIDLLVRTRQDVGRDSFVDVQGFLSSRKEQ